MSRDSKQIADIEAHAKNIRRNIIKMLTEAGSGHTAGSLDLADILASLYFGVMKYNPNNPNDPDRDIFVLSAGHTCPVLYATLAETGIIPESELMTLRKLGSRLQGHPERTELPWVETTSGPLGEGLSQASGMAYAIQKLDDSSSRRVFVVTGDGELDEGNNWEAIMFAAKNKLSNLTVFVDRNSIQLSGKTEQIMPLEPLADKWRAFGWDVAVINGNDVAEILQATDRAKAAEKPSVIIANTVAAKGVDFMEGDYHWHGKVPNKEQEAKALEELA